MNHPRPNPAAPQHVVLSFALNTSALAAMTPDLPQLTRRTFLGNAARGIGAVALGSLLNPASLFAEDGKWRGILPILPFAQTAPMT